MNHKLKPALLAALLLTGVALPRAAGAADLGAPIVIAGEYSGDISVWNERGSKIDSGHTSYNAAAGLAVGDVDGDGSDEIVVVGDVGGLVEIYRLGGATTPRWSFSSGYNALDEIAVGNVMGDGKDEILIVDDVTEDVTIYDYQGNVLATFDVDYTAADGFALGQFDGTGYLELFVAGEALHHVDIFDSAGNLLHWVLTNYDIADGFGVGDLTGDGHDEIVVGGDLSGEIYIYDLGSNLVQQFPGDYGIGDGFVVADVDADDVAEVIVAGNTYHQVDIFNYGGTKKYTWLSDFTDLDAIAVGRHAYPDRDRDGLLDAWEQDGLDVDDDGVVDVDLPAMGASPDHKDIFVELDWVAGKEPKRSSVQAVIEAFKRAPGTAGGFANPDGQEGINVHIDTGTLSDPTAWEGLTWEFGTCDDGVDNDFDGRTDDGDNGCRESGGPGSCTDGKDNDDDGWTDIQDGDCFEGRFSCADGADNNMDGVADEDDPLCIVGDQLGGGNLVTTPVDCLAGGFYAAKAANFAAARKRVFHYAVCADVAVADTCGGGYGEVNGNDFIDLNGNGATLMHELGHNLGLRHGGDAPDNCKPNYVSIMNYDHSSYIQRRDGKRFIDYSPALRADNTRGMALPTINEGALSETSPLDPLDTSLTFVWTDADGKKRRTGLDETVDFSGDGLRTATAVANIDTANSDGDPEDCANSSSASTLTGHDDWSNIKLPFRMAAASDSAPVTPEDHRELRADEIERIERALNSTDLAVLVDDSVDPAGAGEALTYTLTARNVGVNPTAAASLRMTIPSGLTLVSAPGCFLSPDLLTCDVGFLDAGAERVFTATFDIAADLVHVAGGPVTLSANATIKNAAGSDPAASNDAVTESTLVVAKADLVHLGAAMGGVPSELLIGDVAPVTLTESMTQVGPSSPMDVRVTRSATAAPGSSISLPETSVLVSALMKGETRGASAAASVQCALPGVHAFEVASSLSPARPDDIDPDLSNNDAMTSFALECVVPVSIRVRPTANAGRKGVVPVEIRSNAAGEYGLPLAFDATTIDPLSVRFGTKADTWSETGGAFEDHDASHGGADAVMHFEMAESGLSDGEPQACVKGRFTDANGNVFKFFGCDDLRWAGK